MRPGATLRRTEPARIEIVPDRRYVSDLSHELRGPLTVIDMRLQLLAAKRLGVDDLAPEIDQIRLDIRGILDVIDDVLLIVRDDLDEPETSSADVVAADILAAMSLLPGTPRLSLTVAASSCTVPMPTTSLRRCLSALVDNAIKHTPVSGDIAIAISGDDELIEIDVTDTGTGVDPAVLARIFERNVYAARQSGTRASFGIGLALVRETVMRSGGTVGIVDTTPTGTTFRIVLPAASPGGPRH